MAGARWRWRGGILGLFEILESNGYAVEADIRRYYGVDMLGFWRGEITPRQLLVMIYHLPSESITASLSVDKPELSGWGQAEYLLGMLTDRLGELVFITLSANVDEKTRKSLKAPPSVFPDSAIEHTVREETKQMSINDFFSPADIFAEIAMKS